MRSEKAQARERPQVCEQRAALRYGRAVNAATDRPKGFPKPPRRLGWAGLAVLAMFLGAPCGQAQQLQFAHLGQCALESGQVIEDCRLEYRTFGDLRGKGENAVLFPTWFSGATENLQQFVGEQAHVDPSRYFVILAGAFGNGLSSSPSNSAKQPGEAFPRYAIRDMARAQHRLLTEKLGVERLHAVMGISMGGMQTFEWMVLYPDFMARAIPIVGSPQLGSYDLLLWRTQLHVIEEALKAYEDPADERRAGMRVVADIHDLALSSPSRFNSETPRAELEKRMAEREADLIRRYDPYDWASQLRAMIAHDVSATLGGSMEKAAAAVRARVMVVSAAQDHMVTPGPSFDFAKRIGAEVVLLESPCGHRAPGCEQEKVVAAVRRFLGE
jgi:homoserine O-acetyltransferase